MKTSELMAVRASTSKTSELMAVRTSTSKAPELTAEQTFTSTIFAYCRLVAASIFPCAAIFKELPLHDGEEELKTKNKLADKVAPRN